MRQLRAQPRLERRRCGGSASAHLRRRRSVSSQSAAHRPLRCTNPRLTHDRFGFLGAATFNLWKKVGFGGIGLCTVVGAYDLITEEHDHKEKWFPHEKIRNKRFPWTAKDCDFFDLACKRKFFNP